LDEKKKRYRIKKELVIYKPGECLAALEFHHLNSDEKDFILAKNISVSLERLKKEADKCVLVCSNCHRELHSKEFMIEW